MENLFLQKNPLQDFLSSLNAEISTNESTKFITGHVIYNLSYIYKFQLKTTLFLEISLKSEVDPMLTMYSKRNFNSILNFSYKILFFIIIGEISVKT